MASDFRPTVAATAAADSIGTEAEFEQLTRWQHAGTDMVLAIQLHRPPTWSRDVLFRLSTTRRRHAVLFTLGDILDVSDQLNSDLPPLLHDPDQSLLLDLVSFILERIV